MQNPGKMQQRDNAPSPTAYMPPKLTPIKPSAPVARGQIDDNLTPIAFRIPTPEELGIGSKSVAVRDEPIDWVMVERHLDKIGALGHQIEKIEGGYRFSVKMSNGTYSSTSLSKGEAVRSAIAKIR
jgi:hypothetical protein